MKFGGPFALLLCLPLLAGCETLGGIFESDEPPPLPGDRISIIEAERTVTVNPDVADIDIILPPMRSNAFWQKRASDGQILSEHPSLARNPQVVWSRSIGEGRDDEVRLVSEPIVVDGTIYVMDATDRVSALELSSGRLVWQRDLDPPEDDGYFGGGVAFFDDRLYVTTGYGFVAGRGGCTDA